MTFNEHHRSTSMHLESETVDASLDSLCLEHKRRQSQMERLREHASQLGYDIACDVPADGDCFFHSIAHLLGRFDDESGTRSKRLRRELLSFMQSKVSL